VLNLIPRVSHTQPGNVKGYYKNLNEALNKEIQIVASELAKTEK
jgi:predicted transcriptional regulator with HTH domain